MPNGLVIYLVGMLFIGGKHNNDVGNKKPFTLKPGDVIYLKMWRHPEVTDTFYIGADSIVEFPLIGPIKVVGMTASKLDSVLTEAYSRYYKNPQLDVIPLFKVAVMGEVNRPGVYLVKETDGFFEVLALAQGTTSKADLSRAKIQRGDEVITINIKNALNQRKTLKETGLQSGDIIIIPKKFWPSLMEIYYVVATLGLIWSVYTAIKGGK